MQNWLRIKSSSCIKINYLNCFERLLSVAFKDTIPKPTYDSSFCSLTFTPDILPRSFQRDTFDHKWSRLTAEALLQAWEVKGPRAAQTAAPGSPTHTHKPPTRGLLHKAPVPQHMHIHWGCRKGLFGEQHIHVSIFFLLVSISIRPWLHKNGSQGIK